MLHQQQAGGGERTPFRLADNTVKAACLTVANALTPYVQRTLTSCQRFGFSPTILGLNRDYPGNITKLYYVLEYIEQNPSVDTIFYLDSYDVIATNSMDVIMEAYGVFNTPLLFSAELNCWPDAGIKDQYPEVDSPYRYLNSGLYIGNAEMIRQVFDKALQMRRLDGKSDQELLAKVYVSGEFPIMLDHGARIFQSLWGAEHHLVEDRGVWMNERTRSYPILFHANGRSSFPANIAPPIVA